MLSERAQRKLFTCVKIKAIYKQGRNKKCAAWWVINREYLIGHSVEGRELCYPF